jgi:hypothetical protein
MPTPSDNISTDYLFEVVTDRAEKIGDQSHLGIEMIGSTSSTSSRAIFIKWPLHLNVSIGAVESAKAQRNELNPVDRHNRSEAIR